MDGPPPLWRWEQGEGDYLFLDRGTWQLVRDTFLRAGGRMGALIWGKAVMGDHGLGGSIGSRSCSSDCHCFLSNKRDKNGHRLRLGLG